MERLLARLFEDERGPWLLKGDYAFELRYRPNARTTRDLDLSVLGAREESAKAKLEAVHVAWRRPLRSTSATSCASRSR
jgi:hypothetical protein